MTDSSTLSNDTSWQGSQDDPKATRKLICVIVAAAIYLAFQFLVPVPEGLERPAIASVGILIACIVLWVSEALPLIITVVVILIMLPVSGIIPLSQVYSLCGTSVMFFCLVSFGLSAAISATPIPYRAADLLFKVCKNNPRKLVCGFTLCSSVISMVLSNLAACAIFAGLAITILKANGNPKPGSTNLGKALMIGISIGAAMGGFATPVGNSLNILAMEMINEYMGVRVTFLDWMIVGLPLSLIMTLFIGWFVCKMFPPEEVSQGAIDLVRKETEQCGKVKPSEIKFAIWFAVMFVFWLASTWFASINLIVVGLIGLVVAFIPKIDIIDIKAFHKEVSWDVVFMIGGVQALATGLINTGMADWFVNTVLGGVTAWPMVAILLVMAAVVALLHIAIPVGPPVASISLPVLMALALATGVDAGTVAMIVAMHAGVTMILPIDSIALITYTKGYYTMSEFAKFGVIPTLVLIAVSAIAVPPLFALLGY